MKASLGRNGRPPRLQSTVVMVLQRHPEFLGRPSALARYIRTVDPNFPDLKGRNVTRVYSKLRRRFGDFFDSRDLHADRYHVERLAIAADGERVCKGCGATFGYQRPPYATPLDEGLQDQNSFVNPLHRAFKTNPVPIMGRKEGMISRAAATVAEFGIGIEGKLLEKAIKGFEEICKSNRRYQLPQAITSQLVKMIEAECRVRARSLRVARTDEARQAVITCCVRAMERFPLYQETLRRMILDASACFPDLTSTPKGSKRKNKSSLMIEEEERTSRRVDKEEWQELHAPSASLTQSA
jgi:hypothetical protein